MCPIQYLHLVATTLLAGAAAAISAAVGAIFLAAGAAFLADLVADFSSAEDAELSTEGAEFPSEGAEFPSEGADLSAACAVSSLSFFFLAAFALVKFRCAYYSFMLNRKQKHVFQIIRIALVNDRSKLQKNIPTLYYQIQFT